GRVHARARHRAPEPLPELPVEPSPGRRRSRRSRGRMRLAHGADRGQRSRDRGMGPGASMRRVRHAAPEPHGRGRQRAGAASARGPPARPAAIPARTDRAGVTISSMETTVGSKEPRSLLGLAHWLTATLVLSGLSVVITIDNLAYESNNLSAAAQGSPVASELHLAHERVRDSGVLAIGFASIAVVLLLVWQFLAHANLRRFGDERLRFPPAVAVLVWLVPGLDLVLPPLAVRELWKRSDPDVGALDGRAPRASPLVALW